LNQNTKNTFLIFGNSIASIVSSLSLSKNKRNKIFLLNNKRNWGGHFNTSTIKKKNFDPGMFLFEFDGYTKLNSLDPKFYHLKKFSNLQLYSSKIKNFISKFIKTKKIRPLLFYDKKIFHKDYLISNDLEFLKKVQQYKKIFKEISKINIKNLKYKKIHSSQKRNSSIFATKSLKTISIANHGLTFHRQFVEPFCKKVFNDSSKNIISIYHRAAWLPLFWPETIRDVFLNKNKLKTINFEYPNGCVGTTITNKIVKKISKIKNIKIVNINDQINNISFLNSGVIKFRDHEILLKNFIFGGDQNDFRYIKNINLENNFEKVSIGILYLITNKNNIKKSFSIINCIDKNLSFYRLTNQSSLEKNNSMIKLSVEFNVDYLNALNKSKIKIEKLLLKHLNILGIFKSINKLQYELKIYKDALLKPTFDNRKKYNLNFNIMKTFLYQRNMIGPSAGFYKYSFNDQVIQGIRYQK
jgi:hypothetical protein